jgi:hypothetical protein
VSSIKGIIEDLRVSIYTISGPNGLKVGYIGHGAFIPYLTNWIYGKKGEVGLARRIFIGSLNREISHLSAEYDLLICHFHQFYLKNYFSNLFMRIPDFVRQTIDLPNNLTDLNRNIKTRESQKDLNKIKRNGFTSEITNDQKIFKLFYDEFHRPFITLRHGDYAHIETYEKLIPILEEGELLMVKQAAQYVSGVLCRRLGDIYETICSGVYQGDWELVQLPPRAFPPRNPRIPVETGPKQEQHLVRNFP